MNTFRKRKQLYLTSALIGLGAVVTLTGCNKKENPENYEIVNEEITEVDDTTYALNIYNAYLKELGSTKKLEEKDLENIVNTAKSSLILIKLENDEYIQVSREEHYFVENEKEEIRLFFGFDINHNREYRKDLLTQNLLPSEEQITVLSSIEDCIKENEIDNIGYSQALYKGTDDFEEELITKTYGEDVWKCFEELGVPRKVYDIHDFYKAYGISSYQRIFKPTQN